MKRHASGAQKKTNEKRKKEEIEKLPKISSFFVAKNDCEVNENVTSSSSNVLQQNNDEDSSNSK